MKSLGVSSATKFKLGLFIFTIFLHFLVAKMNRYSRARGGFIAIYRFAARELENYNFRMNFRVIFVPISVFHVLPDFSKTKIIWEV